MSRVARNPVDLPQGVESELDEATRRLKVSGAKGALEMRVHPLVHVVREERRLRFVAADSSRSSRAMSGTMRALANNMVVGVDAGFERRLVLTGIGYRASLAGRRLTLALGFSHDVRYELPTGVEVELASPTLIVLRSNDKQQLGQAAADIRAFRPPEPHKGKGIRYENERVKIKETRKSK